VLLGDELIGYRSVRAVGQTYRIIYCIEKNVVLVVVVAIGRRKGTSKEDVYAQAKRLLKLGMIEAKGRKKT
jgi:mRNA interferase RelE/StbE